MMRNPVFTVGWKYTYRVSPRSLRPAANQRHPPGFSGPVQGDTWLYEGYWRTGGNGRKQHFAPLRYCVRRIRRMSRVVPERWKV